MDAPDDLWTTIRDVLPDPEALTAAVAAELREPVDDVRPSVLIGTIALNGQLGPEPVAAAAIEAELARIQRQGSTRTVGRTLDLESLDALLARTRTLAADGSLDLATIVGIQRASGAIAARTGRRMAVLLHRYAVTRRLLWEHAVDAMQAGRLDEATLAAFGRLLLLWNELTWLAVTDGFRTVEREALARAVEARRGALQELLGVIADDAAGAARLRRLAVRQGLDPDQPYRLVAIAPGPESDPIPERPGIGEEELEVLAGRIGHLLGSAGPGIEGPGGGIRLPAVLPLMGRIAVLARDRQGRAEPRAGRPRQRARRPRAGRGAEGATRQGGDARPRGRRGWPSAQGRSTAWGRSPRPTRTWWTPPGPPSGSASAAGSRTRTSSPSNGCCSPTATSPTPWSGRSSARCWRTSGSGRSSSRRSRPTSTRART